MAGQADVFLLLILAFIFPPAAAAFVAGCGADFCLNILLTILAYLPGMIHACWLVLRRAEANERYGYKNWTYSGMGEYAPIHPGYAAPYGPVPAQPPPPPPGQHPAGQPPPGQTPSGYAPPPEQKYGGNQAPSQLPADQKYDQAPPQAPIDQKPASVTPSAPTDQKYDQAPPQAPADQKATNVTSSAPTNQKPEDTTAPVSGT